MPTRIDQVVVGAGVPKLTEETTVISMLQGLIELVETIESAGYVVTSVSVTRDDTGLLSSHFTYTD